MTGAPVEQPGKSKSWLSWLGLVVAIGGFAAVDFMLKGLPATTAARAFVLAARSGDHEGMRARSTADLSRRLEAPPQGSALEKSVEIVRRSKDIGGGFSGGWTRGCINGTIGDARIWFVMIKQEGSWLVADLRDDPRPAECDFDH